MLIIIPTYCEKNNIQPLAREIFATVPDAHIVVVDDNSPDGTAAEVEQLPQFGKQAFLIKREGRYGLRSAYQEGFAYALRRHYETIIQMDADFSHHPRYLPQMLNEIKACDMVLGSRYVDGGNTKNWNIIRRIISQSGGLYARTILGLPFQDLTAGFKCFRRKTLEQIQLATLKSDGYAFQIEVTYRVHKKGFRIKEMPIIFEDRNNGQSKMSSKIFFEAIYRVIQFRCVPF